MVVGGKLGRVEEVEGIMGGSFGNKVFANQGGGGGLRPVANLGSKIIDVTSTKQ